MSGTLGSEDLTPVGKQNLQMKNLGGRVGSYAISTVDLDAWMNEPVIQAPIRARKTRGVKEVIHKVFSDCAVATQDPFWVDKFNTAAIGKFPHKFSFHDGVLTYRKGTKCNSLEVPNNPYEAAPACMEFFRANGGIFSPLDEQNSLELQYSRAHAVLTQQQLTWADANKKVQDCMLSYYIMDMKKLMSLNDDESGQLRQTIRLGIANKYFGKHNIRVENNHIHSIEGLLWNNQTRHFYMHPDLKPKITRSYTRKKDGPAAVDPGQKDTIPQFGIRWKKYMESLDKKLLRSNRRQRRVIINQAGGGVRHLQLVTTPTTTHATSPGTRETTPAASPVTGDIENDDDDDE
jgi:hypothetical protein